MRGEQQQLVRDLGELVDPSAAIRAVGEVLEGATTLLALHDAEGELGGHLANLLAAFRHGLTSSSSRSLIIAVRIRVFTVPSGTSSRSLISRAVRPM
jgi:hypothetical protein